MRMLRVLVVEDNSSDAQYARDMLEGTASSITVVDSVAGALACLDDIDAVLLDLSLPDVDGLPALARLREERPALPILILSDDQSEARAIAAVQAGAQDYLLKGHIAPNALRRALGYAIERSELNGRLAASIEELERQRTSVLELNQLKNDLIAILAHDIKGPLTSVIGFAELLEEGYLEGDAAIDAARTIRSNAQRLATLANDVMTLSRFEHGALDIADERVDVATVLEEAIEPHAAERAISFERLSAHAFVRGDAERLRQVFDNLIRNAVKYSPGGERVSVTLDGDDDVVTATIEDRGMGIPPEDLGRLFERFTRGSNARKAKISGTGIGLFIVKMILERHGGEVRVESVVGEGSRFIVRLPRIESAASSAPMRVTLLTQDQALRRFAAYELRSRGYRVREAASLEDATDVRSGDVLVVDEGAVEPARIRETLGAHRNVRLVALGGSDGGEWDAFLAKPFLVADLLHALSS
jgi:signal transduction histidine kinase